MKHNAKLVVMTAALSSILVFFGYGAMNTATKKRNLEVKTRMSGTIWLEPPSQKTVYLQIENTPDKDMSGLQAKVTKTVQDEGYIITSSPDSAHYWIRANVLKTDKMDLRTIQGFLGQGYEDAIAGVALGAGVTGYNSSSIGTTLGTGLAASPVGMVADAVVEDINYTMVTDTQTSEKAIASVQTDNVAALKQGTSGYKMQTSTQTGNQHEYQTHIVLSANRVNLKFEEAKPVLRDQLVKSVANTLQYTQGSCRATLL